MRGLAPESKSHPVLLRLLIISLLLLLAAQAAASLGGHLRASAAQLQTEDEFWRDVDEGLVKNRRSRTIFPASYRTVRLNKRVFKRAISKAALEGSVEAASTEAFITMPLPDGAYARFRIEESPIMESSFAAKLHDFKTYQGQAIDDPSATMRFGWSAAGLHAIVISPKGIVLVFPYAADNLKDYIVYYTQEDAKDILQKQCLVTDADIKRDGYRPQSQGPDVTANVVSGSVLRTYRLAVAATGEFTQQYGGGNVVQAQTAISQNVNLINAIYRRELSITFNLINNTSIIFTDPNTDGYTNGNVGTMMSENQAKLDSVIGAANYDIGHVYGAITGLPQGARSFSGIAGVGVACVAGQKARGASTMGGGSTADAMLVSGVAHELGHQLDATHTFNTGASPCGPSRTAESAWEPGGGSTLMAYSICGTENLQPTTDTYFHTGSLEQIVAYVTTTGNCAAQSSTGNRVPSVEAGPNYTIPSQTPFALTATAGDPDGDALTYAWEEFDLGSASPPNTDDGSRPIFRSYSPVTNPTRLFPSLQYILNNDNNPPQTYVLNGKTYTTGEALPTTNRTINFRATVRDNRAGGGAVASDAMQVTVVSTAGPFKVTQPDAAVSWQGGSSQVVSWNVAGTSSAPINTSSVRITLSTDGGTTFPLVLAASTPNDGSETITVPNSPTTQARVKVEAVGNVFFDISNSSFTITQGGGGGMGVRKQRFDFDGDKKTDFGYYRNGLWAVLKSGQGFSFASAQFFSWGGAGQRPVVADFDGDGKSDIAYIAPPTGSQPATYAVLKSSANYDYAQAQFFVAGFPVLGDTPVVGDFDGDGKADPGVWRASGGVWIIPLSSTNYTQYIFSSWGQVGDVPVIGDFDGDGKSDFGYYRNGLWAVLKSTSNFNYSSAQFFSWGGVGQQPIVADFDGDGRADVTYIAPPTGSQSAAYAILKSSSNYSYSSAQFFPAGFPVLGDTPVVGDFDGDGKADPGVWRASGGVWIIPLSSTNYTQYIFSSWGQVGDIPLPNDLNMQ